MHGAPWWSKDLQRIVDFNMLSDRAIVVGDNVLRPGAPQFMYWNSVAGPYETGSILARVQAGRPLFGPLLPRLDEGSDMSIHAIRLVEMGTKS